MNKHEMTTEDVTSLYVKFNEHGIDVWIDGGWGVDALMGKQTRPHGDLDIVIQEKDINQIKELLESQGYKVLQRDDLTYNYFHMADNNGHEVDVTAIHFNEKGDGIWGPEENNEFNPADSFKGMGEINSLEIKCISLDFAIKFRLGHEIWSHDAEDVRSLCEKFNLEVPLIYKK